MKCPFCGYPLENNVCFLCEVDFSTIVKKSRIKKIGEIFLCIVLLILIVFLAYTGEFIAITPFQFP
jgi:hypothetical protein